MSTKLIVRKGDTVTGTCTVCDGHPTRDGSVTTGASDTFCEDKLVARHDDIVTASCGHTGTIVATGKTVCEDKVIARVGDAFTGQYVGTLSITKAEDSECS